MELDPVLLSRLQFAFLIAFHILLNFRDVKLINQWQCLRIKLSTAHYENL